MHIGVSRFILRRIATPGCKFKRTAMRFVQFEEGGKRRLGVEKEANGDIVDLSKADPTLPTDMRGFLDGGQRMLLAAKRIPIQYIDDYNDVIIIIQLFFSAVDSGHQDTILPRQNVKEEDAMNYVFGFTVAHDVSARDWQLSKGKNGGQWTIGKAMDCFCPLGPAIVMKEDLVDPHNLGLRCLVNGKAKQDSSTKQMIFQTASLVAFVSRFMTLKPGDLILTGTPPGVGVFRKPPEFLKVRINLYCV
ncbi:hypothetical protein KUTeg_004869 [Tegillarca granosa]|uniref:Fumarylacetoacetase-like C-terminal domain-containing protein n=1 Tax=Tegillarca granosa TaxID=220873 RepID=A0ABQ9FMP8_TEGGR|nr:hypothetical protein KUTeg_004869 [Tegillarca granosa]